MNTPANQYPPCSTHEFTLDNGLKVVVREDHRTPQIALTLYFASLGHERPEEFGIGEVLYNAPPYTSDDMAFISESGAIHRRLGGYAGSGELTENLLVSKEHLEGALRFQSNIMTAELSDDSLRDALRTVKNREESLFISKSWFSPEIESLAGAGSKYYRPRQAISANLDRLSLDCIRRWRRSRRCPDNAHLAIVGDVAIDEVRRLIECHFADIPRGAPPFRSLGQVPAAPGYRRITQYLDAEYPDHALMIFIFNTKPAEELKVLGSLLAGTPLARFAAFEEQRSSIVTNLRRENRQSALFALAFHTRGAPSEAEENLWKFLDEVKRSSFSCTEVESAINEVCAPIQDRYNTLQGQSETLATYLAFGEPWQLVDDEITLFRRITSEGIHLAANNLTRENVTVVCALPIETKPK